MSRTADSVAPPSSSTTPQRPPRFALLIATGFGLGYIPKAPGTAGSIGAVILFWAADAFQQSVLPDPPQTSNSVTSWFVTVFWLHIAVGLVLAAVGHCTAHKVARGNGSHDPQWIVIDEISGQFFTLIPGMWPVPVAILSMLPQSERLFVVNNSMIHLAGDANWKYLLAGFILFRVFDIWKPWPVRQAEKLPGGWGIMADDWVAGIYAALCLWVLRAVGM